jgi:hypothetical protein
MFERLHKRTPILTSSPQEVAPRITWRDVGVVLVEMLVFMFSMAAILLAVWFLFGD